eukprot:CAMPEP_0172598710 /NCGR_PEP_ID=MMETSP1068-20121228/18777_1 /TAXON_ID=35684 /ORGANISM="Pseudopedinella elastica, Strain CCMP716" /LENGTH=407 /DNA_ID=CAMNT_0013398683 /DNA_START=137 /DNA_END=1361 /DNA_ORIENTATION=-
MAGRAVGKPFALLPRPGQKNSALILRGGSVSEEKPSLSPTQGRLILISVALLYGSLNTLLRALYLLPGGPVPSVLSMTRGFLAAMCFVPILALDRAQTPAEGAQDSPSTKPAPQRGALVKAGLELALWNAGAQGLINAGLLVSDAARASFLMQTSVVFTPVVAILSGARVEAHVWAGAAVALLGLATLSGLVGAAGGAAATTAGTAMVSTGDALCLGGALCWSLYIFRLGALGPKFPEIPLQALKTTALAALYTGWAGASAAAAYAGGGGWGAVGALWPGWASGAAWLLLLASAVGPGALADILQQIGQTAVGASEANVILCAEPLFTAFTARIFLGELTTLRDKVGGGMILLAALIASGSLAASFRGDELAEASPVPPGVLKSPEPFHKGASECALRAVCVGVQGE